MKKTVSVNIKGMNFMIEEDAYELLQSYMNRLTHSLRNEKGSKEIIEDIEFRVAELCSNYLNEKKQVIEKEDIEQIIKTLGEPEEYVENSDEPQAEEKKYTQQNTGSKNDKRLYRDVENAKIAGVCSGISNYLNIDVIIIRAIFLITFFFAGFGFPLYIVLWIIMPKAFTTIERLRMQGKPITVDSVREEVEIAANKIREESNSFANRIRKNGELGKRINSVGKIIRLILGMGLYIAALGLLAFITISILGLSLIPIGNGEEFISVTEIGNLIFEHDSDVFWFWTAGLATGFSTVLFLILLGSKIIFRLKSSWTKITLSSLFFIGVVGITVLIYCGIKTGREMTFEGEKNLYVGAIATESLEIIPHNSNTEQVGNYTTKSNSFLNFIEIDGNKINESGIHFEYKYSKDSIFHVYQNFTAHGSSNNRAINKAKNIHHSIGIEGSILHVNTNYTFPIKDKLRDQEVYIIIEIPHGKQVLINNQRIRLGAEDFKEEISDINYSEEGILNGNGEYHSW